MTKKTISRRNFLAATASLAISQKLLALAEQTNPAKPIRIAFIGVGGRGTGLLKRLLEIPGTVVPAICDINENNLNRAIEIVKQTHRNTPEGYSKGPYDYRRMLERDDFDAVLIATSAELHAPMAIDSMLAGKDVATEVLGASTMDDCWSLVKTKEKTGQRYMLLENYVYMRHLMMAYNMARQGVFGDIHYAECSYIHDCRHLRFNPDQTMTWRGQRRTEFYGNLYPTHSLGPISKMLGIHQGDRMISLSSQISKSASLHQYAIDKFGADSKAADYKFISGDMSVSLIKTAKDKLITLYYDSISPRPTSNYYLIQGPKGVFDSRFGIYIDGKSPKHKWEARDKYPQYEHDYWKNHGKEASKAGHGGGDYFVLGDFVNMVRNQQEPFIDVYDSAAWSSIMPLSQQAIDKQTVIEIPDFTGGKWKDKNWRKDQWL